MSTMYRSEYHHLPDTMYFSSPKELDELKGRVYLSPRIGISSMFVIDRFHVVPEMRGYNYGLHYRQWEWNSLGLYDKDLDAPLNKVNIIHNIPELKGNTYNGISSGYIYEVYVGDFMDKLDLGRWYTSPKPPEVIYRGEDLLPIISRIPHTIEWEFSFDEQYAKDHGYATKNN